MKLNRRQFLRSLGFSGMGLALAHSLNLLNNPLGSVLATGNPRLQNIRPVHDPCIIKEDDTYYLFHTGPGITWRTSSDLQNWVRGGNVFSRVPAWAREEIPDADSIWAPDISYFNDRYHLYYAVSTFGSNHSCIGLATTPTLHPEAADYGWTDHGAVIWSQPSDNWNAIDPNLVLDTDGQPWLAFGSFWSGIKMRKIDPETGGLSSEDTQLYALAEREAPNAIEAPFIIRHGGYYYLFVSFDFCCRGADSTYHVVVGRSQQVTGPYVDRDGVPMLEGGGTQVTYPTARWRGPGHNAVLQEETGDYLVYHAYDAYFNGLPTLFISPITWDADGWPSVSGM